MPLDLSFIAAGLNDDVLSNDPGQRFYQRLTDFLEGDHQTKHQEPREPGFHVSGISRICARQAAIMQALDVYPAKALLELEHLFKLYTAQGMTSAGDVGKEFVDPAGSVKTQDHGTALHRWFQREYLGVSQMLYGDWYCAGCGKEKRGYMPLACDCGQHWRDAITYRELTVRFEIAGLTFSGHVDGLWVDPEWGWEKRLVNEIKTVSTSKYDNLRKPVFPHVVQCHGYMHGLGIRKAILVYIDRGKDCLWSVRKGVLDPGPIRIKTFTIPFNDDLWSELESSISDYSSVLNKIVDDPQSFKDRDWQDVAQDWEPICDIKSCDAAQACPVRDECFELDV